MAEELELQPELRWFAQEMEILLRKLNYKPRGSYEMDEMMKPFGLTLGRLVRAALLPKTERSSAAIVGEAAHAAIYLMLIADIANDYQGGNETPEGTPLSRLAKTLADGWV